MSVERQCERCGKQFWVYPKRAKARFCSFPCRSKPPKQCPVCDSQFHVKPSDWDERRTCSRSCAMRLQCQEGKAPRQGQAKRPGEKEKISATLRAYYGDDPTKHWNWKGGSWHQHGGKGWAKLRKAVLARDGHRCRGCGITEADYGRGLSIHHRRPAREFATRKEAHHIDNLAACCQSCHMKAEYGKIII